LLKRLILALAIASLSAGCGTSTAAAPSQAGQASVSALKYGSVPDPSRFQIIHGMVIKVLPEDTSGLPHQNFVVSVDGAPYEVNNDTVFGTKVPNLKVGMSLEIKGVEYHDSQPHKDGIHWTHHAKAPGDAGYIKTADGHLYQ
jgi:hypothetical protein